MDRRSAVERFRMQLTRRDLEFVFAELGRDSWGLVWIVTALAHGVVKTRHVRVLGEPFAPTVIDEAAAERFANDVLG